MGTEAFGNYREFGSFRNDQYPFLFCLHKFRGKRPGARTHQPDVD